MTEKYGYKTARVRNDWLPLRIEVKTAHFQTGLVPKQPYTKMGNIPFSPLSWNYLKINSLLLTFGLIV